MTRITKVTDEIMRQVLEEAGEKPIGINDFLTPGELVDVIALDETNFIIGASNIGRNLERKYARLLVAAHMYLWDKYNNGQLGNKPNPKEGEHWWVKSKYTNFKFEMWKDIVVEIYKAKQGLVAVYEGSFYNLDNFNFIQKIERPEIKG